MTHKKMSSKGGKTVTPRKLEALRLNLIKARAARGAKSRQRSLAGIGGENTEAPPGYTKSPRIP